MAVVQRVCEECSAAFLVEAAQVRVGWGRFCSKLCRNRHNGKHTSNPKFKPGIEHLNWKGGKTASYRRRRLKEDPKKVTARKLANQAARRGYITKAPCEICGAAKVEAHHDDYDKPYEVRWLCIKHHREVHKSVS